MSTNTIIAHRDILKDKVAKVEKDNTLLSVALSCIRSELEGNHAPVDARIKEAIRVCNRALEAIGE
jgi:hypothetical protein